MLTRGFLEDFYVLTKLYSAAQIRIELPKCTVLDPKTINFCSYYFNLPKSKMHVSSFYYWKGNVCYSKDFIFDSWNKENFAVSDEDIDIIGLATDSKNWTEIKEYIKTNCVWWKNQKCFSQ